MTDKKTTHLNSPLSPIRVERVPMEGYGSGTAILKRIPDDLPPEEIPPSFREEWVNYLFLETLRDRFSSFPRLYRGDRTAMLLEDLGPDDYAYETMEECGDRLARTMARLHETTAGKEAELRTLRERHGLPEEDLRVWSTREQNLFFRIGLERILADRTVRSLEPLFLQAQQTVNDPGIFKAFIHDDIAARRQTVSTGDDLYFIDFETGKFGHRFLDLLKPILGKVERRRDPARYFLNNPAFSWSLVQSYREYATSLRNGEVPPEAWNRHLNACAIFLSVANMGVAFQADTILPPLTSLGEVLYQIRLRLFRAMKANPDQSFRPIRDALEGKPI